VGALGSSVQRRRERKNSGGYERKVEEKIEKKKGEKREPNRTTFKRRGEITPHRSDRGKGSISSQVRGMR